MADWEVTDELWARIRPLLPVVQRRRTHPGRRRLEDRACLNGALFVLVTGIRWDRLPIQLGYGSGVTCWRRLRVWTQAGVWDRLHELLLAELHAVGRIDWSRAAADASHIRAKRGDDAIGPSPVDRGRPGSKHHALVDGTSLPLAVALTGGNGHDSTRLIELVDAVPPVRGRPGRPDAGPTSSRRIGPTTPSGCATSFERVGSGPCWPAAASDMAPGWAASGGWSSGFSAGCTTATGAWPPAGNTGLTSTSGS